VYLRKVLQVYGHITINYNIQYTDNKQIMCQKRIKRISLLGKKLFDLNIHAIIIPSSDPHQSEYLADHWKIREWFSGFTGSTGTLVITRHEAGLWTDSRYYLQAASELTESGIQLFKQGEPGIPDPIEYLCKNLESQSKIAINPNIWNHQSAKDARIKLEKAGHDLMTQYDPAEEIWNEEGRPSLPERKIFIHDLEYAGSSVSEKLQSVRKGMMSHDVDQHLITTLDDIAWLMNLRGHDIEFNPVFMSFVVVRKEDAILFIDREKLGQNVIHHLEAAGVLTKSYSDVSFYLQSVRSPILMNTDDCNDHLYHQVNFEYIVEGPTITRLLKACKTSSEIAHIDAVMVKDGIALAHVFFDLFQKLKGEGMTEAEFAASIAKSRSEQSGYYGESFPAIVGYQANGAIVHYRPKLGESARIRPEGLLLCDSGGQYVNGTTDITRTLAVGPVSEAQCDSYTRVLKGHIAIDQAEFPEGTTGGMLDILARQHLWKNGFSSTFMKGHKE